MKLKIDEQLAKIIAEDTVSKWKLEMKLSEEEEEAEQQIRVHKGEESQR